MFQIYAAKMFEQRVMNAYREKAAADRAAKLIEELEEDEYKKKQKEENKIKKVVKEKERQRYFVDNKGPFSRNWKRRDWLQNAKGKNPRSAKNVVRSNC